MSAMMENGDASRQVPIGVGVLPPLAFRVPDGIHAMEIGLEAAERVAAVRRLIRDIYPQGDEALWGQVELTYRAIVDSLLSEGVSFFGVGLYAIDDGVAHCAVNVAVIESGQPNQDVAARGIKEILQQESLRDVRWLDLPCGPAVSSVSFRKLMVDSQFTRSGNDEPLILGQIQVHVPFPTAPYTAIFTMDTAALDQWAEFSACMAGIVRSVSFSELVEPLDRTSGV